MTAGATASAPSADQPASPAVKAAPVVIAPDATAGDAFRVSLASCLEHLDANEPLFLRDRHADNLHQTRVSWRRARAAFSLFRELVRTDEAGMEIKVRMREIVLPLGPARDADVLLARAVAEEWPAREQRALRGRRRRTYAVAAPLLRSPQWVEMKTDLLAWLAAPDWLDNAADLRDAPARVVTDAALERRYARIVAAGDTLLTMPAHDLHKIRIEGKKFRYGCEFFAGLYADALGTPPAEYAAVMSAMQDAFGAANDYATAAHVLAAQGISLQHLGPHPGRSDVLTAWEDVMVRTPFWR